MNYKIVLISCILLIVNYLNAKDSIDYKKYTVEELKIEADKSFSKNAYKFNSTMKIDRSEISKYPGKDMNNIIQSSPGFYIKDYGGLSGLKTVSIRGSSSSQVQIIMNGMPINSNQTGTFDFGLFPKNMISSIELSRGGISADGGNNAISGTIDISIEPNRTSILESTLSYGSFNALSLDFNYNLLSSDNPISFYSSINSGDGDFTFQKQSNNEQKRENAGFFNLNTAVVSKFSLKNFIIKPLLLLKYEKKGVPGAVLSDRTLNSVAETEQKYFLATVSSSFNFSDNSILSVNSSFIFDDFNYNENNGLTEVIAGNNNFYNRTFRVKPEIYKNYYGVKIRSGIDYEYSSVSGDFLDPDVDDYVSRNSVAAYLSWNYEMENTHFNTDILASVRWIAVDNITPIFTQNLGLITQYNKLPVYFKLNFSKNFRLPTFNEMYYLNYGNSDLKPELSYNLNSTILFDFKYFSVDVTGFRIETEDLIVSVPKSPVSWSAQNIGLAVSNGIEIMMKTDVFNVFKFTFSYTLQQVKDKSKSSMTYDKFIPYVPQEILNSMVNLNVFDINYGLVLNYSSHRFALPDNSYNSLLNSYYEMDVFAEYKFAEPNISLRFEVNNITDNSFSIIKNFPMPGRNVHLNIGYKL